MAVISMKQLLEAGVHFGHQTRRWNPKMAQYIFTERNGIYIIDLQKTVRKADEAYNFVRDLAMSGKSILFVGTKKQAQESIAAEAQRCNMFYVNNRWLGGMLTNFRTIRTRVDRLNQIDRMEQQGQFDVLPKKEVIRLQHEREKLEAILGVTFDSYNGEAFFNDKMGRVIDELKAKNLLTISDGASIVDLDEEKTGMPPCLILKKDGATLYATRDIAAALWRKDEYDFYKCLYIVAYQQDLHFRQWFKVVEKMGYEWAKDLVHVAFGMISYEGQSLSTRKGHVVFLEDLLLNAIQKARAIIEEKSPDLDNKDEVARQVGIGAVIYADLQNNRIKDIDFSWERALSFDGETGPYVQYTHARCCSALRKAEGLPPAEPDYAALSDDFAQELLRQLSRFPETVREAAARYEPSIVTRAVTELCKAYNKFYYENRILEEDAGVREARVRLTRAVRDTIRTGLWLIGMEAPERM